MLGWTSRLRLPRAFCNTFFFRASEKSLATMSTMGMNLCMAFGDNMIGFSLSRLNLHSAPFL